MHSVQDGNRRQSHVWFQGNEWGEIWSVIWTIRVQGDVRARVREQCRGYQDETSTANPSPRQ